MLRAVLFILPIQSANSSPKRARREEKAKNRVRFVKKWSHWFRFHSGLTVLLQFALFVLLYVISTQENCTNTMDELKSSQRELSRIYEPTNWRHGFIFTFTARLNEFFVAIFVCELSLLLLLLFFLRVKNRSAVSSRTLPSADVKIYCRKKLFLCINRSLIIIEGSSSFRESRQVKSSLPTWCERKKICCVDPERQSNSSMHAIEQWYSSAN